MDDRILHAATIVIAGALPAFIFAYAIGIKRALHLISGWNQNDIAQPQAFAQVFAIGMLAMALILCAAAVLVYLHLISKLELGLLLLVSVIIPSVASWYCNRRFRQQ